MTTETYDVVVIGGGAAGLSAALVLGRARRAVAVVDAGAPRNAPATHMQGFLSRDGMPPDELLRVAREEVRGYGVTLIDDHVTEIETGFSLRLAAGRRIVARRLLFATGATDELPEIAGARERWGRDFLHCPYCHGWEVRDRAIGVLGTNPGSIDHAHLLREWSSDIVVFTHTLAVAGPERAALETRGIEIVDGRVVRFSIEDDRLTAVVLADGRAVRRDAVFIRPTLHGRSGSLAASLGCAVDEGGFVEVDAAGRTSVPGVWAAGNAANPKAQVITAAGEGSAAAIEINNDLVREDVMKTRASIADTERTTG